MQPFHPTAAGKPCDQCGARIAGLLCSHCRRADRNLGILAAAAVVVGLALFVLGVVGWLHGR
jgi:hypothetical protein